MVYEQSIERQKVAAATRELTRREFEAAIRTALPAGLRDLAFVADVASQDPRPVNPMSGPKRIAVYDPATARVEEELLTGILEFVPARAHLYRVFSTSARARPRAGAGGPAALAEAGRRASPISDRARTGVIAR